MNLILGEEKQLKGLWARAEARVCRAVLSMDPDYGKVLRWWVRGG